MIAIRRLLLIATAVRAAYVALSLLLVSRLDDYDTSAVLLSDSCDDSWPEVVAQAQQQYPWVLWDSVFMHRISTCGYEFEQYFAFFPGLPGLVYLIRSAGVVPGPYAFSVITLGLNNGLFLLSVVLLAKLSDSFLQDDKLSITAVLVFIVSPASIHHSMLYTEALFTATSWLGLYLLYCRGNSLGASLAFAASSATRSNGLLNAGFNLHEHGRGFIKSWQHNKVSALRHIGQAAVCSAITVAPYFIYMAFGYQQFCTGVYGGQNQRPWCSKLLPSAYGYVQDVYWDVGFLRYYRPSQIPQFLIAAPTLIISLWGALAYACGSPHNFITGGLLSPEQLTRCFSSSSSGSASSSSSSNRVSSSRSSQKHTADTTKHTHCDPGNNTSINHRALGCVILQAAVVGYKGSCCTNSLGTVGDPNSAEIGHGKEAGHSREAAAAIDAKHPRIPGVAYESLRMRQVKSSENISEQHTQQQQQQQTGLQFAVDAQPGSKCRRPCTCGSHTTYYSPKIAVFVIHWLFLTCVCIAVMHIQVATRFLSSCVPLYWFAAVLMRYKGNLLQRLLWLYCFSFMGMGAVYFTNFYPWT